MIYSSFDVVAVPFPFSDSEQVKLRPAIVVSRIAFNSFGLTTLMMVTSAVRSLWPGDVLLDYAAAGLKTPSIGRLKLASIDNRLIRSKIGSLTAEDQQKLIREMHKFLAV